MSSISVSVLILSNSCYKFKIEKMREHSFRLQLYLLNYLELALSILTAWWKLYQFCVITVL